MRKRFITAAAVAAMTASMFLNACASNTGATEAPTTQAETKAPETEAQTEAQTESETEATEAETEAKAEDVIRTEAVYVKDSEFSGEGQMLFKNDELGEFICNISDFTVLPEELKDGETYVVSHSMVMTMSLPGQLPQVYSIRETDDTYKDSIGTVKAVEDESILFEQADGSQFMINKDSLGDTEVKEGDLCVVSHTDVMTRSMPGTYTEVNRVDVLPQAEESAEESGEAVPAETLKAAETVGESKAN